MPSDIRQFPVTLQPGSTPAAPVTVALAMPPRVVHEVRVRVPPGPRGEVGWAIGAAGQPVYPFAAGTYVVTDDDDVSWPLDSPIDSGAWQLFAYNTGTFPHTLYVTFLCTVVDRGPGSAPPAPLSPDSLQPAT